MLDEHMKLQPQLAESYEASEDAKEFVFHLRKGVTFQDGTPFDAAAVKFSFDRAGNPDNHLKRQSSVRDDRAHRRGGRLHGERGA